MCKCSTGFDHVWKANGSDKMWASRKLPNALIFNNHLKLMVTNAGLLAHRFINQSHRKTSHDTLFKGLLSVFKSHRKQNLGYMSWVPAATF